MRIQRGVTLVELMIVVAVIGVLTAIALPAYQGHAIRAKIAEGLVAVSAARTAVSEAYAQHGEMLPTAALMGIQTQTTRYVSAIGWRRTGTDSGDVTVTLSNDFGLGEAAGATLILRTSALPATGGLIWHCVSDTLPPTLLPNAC